MARKLCTAGRRLNDWLKEHGHGPGWLAEQIDCDRVVLWRWMVGDTTPHIDSAAAIEKLTDGFVPATLWARDKSLHPKVA